MMHEGLSTQGGALPFPFSGLSPLAVALAIFLQNNMLTSQDSRVPVQGAQVESERLRDTSNSLLRGVRNNIY